MSFAHDWGAPRTASNFTSFFNDSILKYLIQDRPLDRLHPSPDTTALVLVLVLGVCAFVTNAISITVFLSWSKMRQAENIMLLNVSLADMLFCAASLVPAFATHVFDVSSNAVVCSMVYYCLSVCVYVSVYSPVAACFFRFLSEVMRRSASRQRQSSSRVRVWDERNRHLQDIFFNNFKNDVNNRLDNFLTPTSAAISCLVIWVAFCVANANVFHSNDTNIASVIVLHQPLQCDHKCFMTLRQREEEQRQKERELHSPSEVFKQHFNQKIQLQQHPQRHLPPHQRQQLGYVEPIYDATNEDNSLKSLWLIFLISAFLLPLSLISLLSGLLFQIHCTRTPNRAPISELTNSTRITASLTASPVSYSSFTATNSILADYAAVVSSRKEAVVVIMAISIARFLCWLPIQVCLLIDVYGFSTQHHAAETVFFHDTMEVYGACFALIACCINPIIYITYMPDFRRSLVRCRRRWLRRKERKNITLEAINAARIQSRGLPKPDICTATTPLDHPLRYIHHAPISTSIKESPEPNDTILSILCDSSNKINYN